MFESIGAETADGGGRTLTVAVALDDTVPATGGTKGLFRRDEDDTPLREIPVAVLRDSLRRAVDGLQEAIAGITVAEDGLPLKEAQVSFEVTASGGVAIAGLSAQTGVRGCITLTFGR